jgi:hypothetical protein
MPLPTCRQAKHKAQNLITYKILGEIVEKSRLPFEFHILDLFRT